MKTSWECETLSEFWKQKTHHNVDSDQKRAHWLDRSWTYHNAASHSDPAAFAARMAAYRTLTGR